MTVNRRRHPRACELVATTDTGEQLRFVGRLAEVAAAFLVELATEAQARPTLETERQWSIALNVLERQIIPDIRIGRAPIRFRDYADEREAS